MMLDVMADIALRLRNLADQIEDVAAAMSEIPEFRGDPDLLLDNDNLYAIWKGRRLYMSASDYRCLEYIARRPNTLKTRESLMAYLDKDLEVSDRAIDSTVKRIRAAFRHVDPDFDRLTTIYSAGYVWRCDEPRRNNG